MYPYSLLSKELGASTHGIRRWVKAYPERGEAGLRDLEVFSKKPKKLPGAVCEKIVDS